MQVPPPFPAQNQSNLMKPCPGWTKKRGKKNRTQKEREHGAAQEGVELGMAAIRAPVQCWSSKVKAFVADKVNWIKGLGCTLLGPVTNSCSLWGLYPSPRHGYGSIQNRADASPPTPMEGINASSATIASAIPMQPDETLPRVD